MYEDKYQYNNTQRLSFSKPLPGGSSTPVNYWVTVWVTAGAPVGSQSFQWYQ